MSTKTKQTDFATETFTGELLRPSPAIVLTPETKLPVAPTKRTRSASGIYVTLDPEVHAHFSAKAAEDDRELGKFLARKLKAIHKAETAPSAPEA
jgi:hypothetical protein